MASPDPKIFALVDVPAGTILIHEPEPTAIERLGGILCHICNNIFEGKKKKFDVHYSTEHGLEGENIVYTCVVCNKQINSYTSFRNHCYLNHVVKNKFQCEHCKKSFCKLSILNNHVTAVHTHKCTSCDEKFSTKVELNAHKSKHYNLRPVKNNPPFNCITCKQLIKTIEMCEKHINEHTETEYTCPICNEALKNKTEATNHLSKHYDESESVPTEVSETVCSENSIILLGGIRCCHCDMVSPNREQFDAHFNTEHDKTPIVYTCNICSKQYDKYVKFMEHCHFHISKENFQCNECNKTFRRLSRLVVHTEICRLVSSGDNPFTCNSCKTSFDNRRRLLRHIRSQHQRQHLPLPCTYPGCAHLSPSPREWALHRQRRHDHAAEHRCRACGLQLRTARAAAAHLGVHARARLACPVCARAYRAPHAARAHARTHWAPRAPRTHVCTHCQRTFALRSRLVEHERSHGGARRLACPRCPATFDRPHKLREHEDSHAGRRPYACPVCARCFTGEPNWHKHLRRYHRLAPPLVATLRREREQRAAADTAILDTLAAMHEDLERAAAHTDAPAHDDTCSPLPVECSQPPAVDACSLPPLAALAELTDELVLPHIDPLLTIKPDQLYLHHVEHHSLQPTDASFPDHDSPNPLRYETLTPVAKVEIPTLDPNLLAKDCAMYLVQSPACDAMFDDRCWEVPLM